MPENEMYEENLINEKPSIVFGIIADVQYADTDDILQYGRVRYYRNSVKLLRKALNEWKEFENKNNLKLKFILQMGDLIDGFRTSKTNTTEQCLSEVLNEFESVDVSFPRLLNLWGNHEMFAYKRYEISNTILNTAHLFRQNLDVEANYYYYDINEKIRLICLDEYEISLLGFDDDNEIYKEAVALCDKSAELSAKTSDPEEKKYLERFKVYNGGISETQFKWLQDQLDYCKNSNKNVILSGHIPLLTEASDSCAVWNANEILDLIWSYDNLVLAYLAGHYHPGGYYLDKKNIHHLTLNSILETPLDTPTNVYVTVFVYDNKIVFKNQISSRSFTVNF